MPALRSMEAENVVYLGSFSKIFAPGFRVGWALAPHAVREKLVLTQEAATLCPPVFSQFAIATYLEEFDWRSQIIVYRDMYRQRRDAMLQGLVEHMPPGTTWTHPHGGFFVWVTLPEGLDSQSMLPRAVNARVAYTTGTAFYADGLGSRNMRLSFCFPTPERILEGTRRLGEVLEQELEMHRTFGLGIQTQRHYDLTTGPAPDVSTSTRLAAGPDQRKTARSGEAPPRSTPPAIRPSTRTRTAPPPGCRRRKSSRAANEPSTRSDSPVRRASTKPPESPVSPGGSGADPYDRSQPAESFSSTPRLRVPLKGSPGKKRPGPPPPPASAPSSSFRALESGSAPTCESPR